MSDEKNLLSVNLFPPLEKSKRSLSYNISSFQDVSWFVFALFDRSLINILVTSPFLDELNLTVMTVMPVCKRNYLVY